MISQHSWTGVLKYWTNEVPDVSVGWSLEPSFLVPEHA